jgi:hypothetical protein
MPGGKKDNPACNGCFECWRRSGLLVLLAEKISKSPYQTLVFVIQSDTTIKFRIESKGAPVYCFNRSRPSIYNPLDLILFFYKNIRDICSLCGHDNVDVVHCHLSDLEFIGVPGRDGCMAQIG